MINRDYFFDSIRSSLLHVMSDGQVAGINAILDEWEKRGLTDLRQLAYMLATTYHETGHTMQPIEEYGKGAGHKYGEEVNGHKYYGRGFVQLTWLDNYKLFGIADNPEKALELPTATNILFEGMTKGMFTGKKLSNYFTDTSADWVNARRIINGTDKAELIAGYAHKFMDALNENAMPQNTPETPLDDTQHLSEHFTLHELLKSQTGTRHGFTEQFNPPQEIIDNLTYLCVNLLEPIREKVNNNKPLSISSGYRCERTNDAVGGKPNSQHKEGEAADIDFGSKQANKTFFEKIRDSGIVFDQLLNEFNYAWVHVSLTKEGNRQQVLDITH